MEQILSCCDQTPPALTFLLEEYKKTQEFYLNLSKKAASTAQQCLVFSASLIAFLYYLLKDLTNHPKLLVFSNYLVPIIGIIVTSFFICIMYNFRRREYWAYSRMNLIRKIFLDSDKNIDTSFYTESKYGGTSIVSLNNDWRKFKRSEFFFYIYMIQALQALWLSFFVYQILLSFTVDLTQKPLWLLILFFIGYVVTHLISWMVLKERK